MNPQIRRVGIVLLVLFSALFVQLNWLQVIDANSLNNNPGNSRAVGSSVPTICSCVSPTLKPPSA